MCCSNLLKCIPNPVPQCAATAAAARLEAQSGHPGPEHRQYTLTDRRRNSLLNTRHCTHGTAHAVQCGAGTRTGALPTSNTCWTSAYSACSRSGGFSRVPAAVAAARTYPPAVLWRQRQLQQRWMASWSRMNLLRSWGTSLLATEFREVQSVSALVLGFRRESTCCTNDFCWNHSNNVCISV